MKVSPAPTPHLSAFDVSPDGSKLTATFTGVRALDTLTRRQCELDYFVTADLGHYQGLVCAENVSLFPLHVDGEPVVETGTRFRPGARNTRALTRLLADRLADAFPDATHLQVTGRRTTDGFTHPRERELVVPLRSDEPSSTLTGR